MSRVRIGTCSNPADAALVRSMFSAHGLAVVIGAEHHASLFGPLGASFLSLDIWVDEQDSEEAVALLRDLRERDASSEDDEAEAEGEAEGDHDDDDVADADDGQSGVGDGARGDLDGSVALRIDRRRRTGIALLFGCIVTFGTAHMFTRAWMRGFALAAIEVVGIMHLGAGHAIGGAVIAATILADLMGALWRVRAVPKPALPEARIHGA